MKTTASKTTRQGKPDGEWIMDADERQRMIEVAAYYRAERRGFDGGDPMQDWLEAEAEIDNREHDPEASPKQGRHQSSRHNAA